MKVSMIQGISNRRGGEYTSPSLQLMEVSAESGFAASDEKTGIYASPYLDGEAF